MSRAGSICPVGAEIFAGGSWAFLEATVWLRPTAAVGEVELPETALGACGAARLSEMGANVSDQRLFLASSTSTSKGCAALFATALTAGAFWEARCAWSARDWRYRAVQIPASRENTQRTATAAMRVQETPGLSRPTWARLK